MYSKEEVLREMEAARAELREAVDGLTPEQMRRSGAVGIWSVKDVLAHLTAWESELVTALNDALKGRKPAIIDIDEIDEWNEDQYHANVRRSLEATLDDFEAVYKALWRRVEEFNERKLTDNRVYSWMEGEPLSYLIAENAYLHEQEHADEIRAWREAEGI